MPSDSDRLPMLAVCAALCLLAGDLMAQPANARPADSQGKSVADRETARALVGSGHDKLDAGDLQGALSDFEGADAIMHVPTTGVLVADVLARLGRLLEATERLHRVITRPRQKDEPPAFLRARQKADDELARLRPLIPQLRLKLVTAQGLLPVSVPLTVRVDGNVLEGKLARLPRKVDPGTHQVVIRADGYREATVTVQLKESQSLEQEVMLEPGSDGSGAEDSAGLSDLQLASVVSLGVGGVALVAGIITGGLSLSAVSELNEVCPTHTDCGADAMPAHDRAINFANASNVSFALAGLGIAAGAVTLTLSLREEPSEGAPSATTKLRISPAGLISLEQTF